MSNVRGIWNDGQGLTTPELQRPIDVGSNIDDRVHEVLLTPGILQKRIMPISDEDQSTNPRLLVIPGSAGGALRVQPCVFVAGDPSVANAVKMSASLLSSLDSALVTSNASGSTRIDLLYATVARSTPASIGSPTTGVAYVGQGRASLGAGAQQSRKIKDVSTNDITAQTVNIYDVPTVTLTILPGTPGAGVPPSPPADSASAFNFSLAAITVANGYTSGSAVAQANIAPKWNGAWVPPNRIRGTRPADFYIITPAQNELPGGSGTGMVGADYGGERWGSDNRVFAHLKLLSASTSVNLDGRINWNNRFIFGFWAYLGSATAYPIEVNSGTVHAAAPTVSGSNVLNSGIIPMFWSGTGLGGSSVNIPYGATASFSVSVSSTNLRLAKTGTVIDGTNGDALVLVVYATDRLVNGI